MTQKTDLSSWPTKQQAAELIGCSSKTVEKLAADRKLQSAQRRNPGSPPQRVYHPDDVARVAEERRPIDAFVVPVSEVREGSEKKTHLASQTSLTRPLDTLVLLTEALREAAQGRQPERLFLSVKEASEHTGLTQRYLREEIAKGRLQAIQDGRRVRIRRKDLEAL